jgi:ubiquinone/menaquinone biosynthesis C-methylase UbiE
MMASFLKNWQQRLFAWGLAQAGHADERNIRLKDCTSHANMAELKQTLLGDLRGTVLEIGPGAGPNLGYYPADIHWIGIEPNLHMHPYIQREAGRFGLQHVELRGAPVETIELPEASIDAVVSTQVLCSVDDLDASLRRIRRMLKPGGRFVFLEHVAAQEGTCTRAVQHVLTPLWKSVFDGCHPNRETSTSLDRAGFACVEIHSFRLSLPVVGPHIAGVAIR